MPKIVSLSTIPRSKYDKLKTSFLCKNEQLDKHIKQFAFSHQKEGLFQTYFFIDDKETYLGYISVSIATIERDKIDDELDIPASIKYSIPALKITRLCTFDGFCGNGVGKTLMAFANILGAVQQTKMGCRALIVDSKKEAVSFYTELGFVEVGEEEDGETIFMVYDLLKPSELTQVIPNMIAFCEQYHQDELIEILALIGRA